MLELDGNMEMELELPVLDDEKVMQLLPNQDEVYQTALANRPEIQSSKLVLTIPSWLFLRLKAGIIQVSAYRHLLPA